MRINLIITTVAIAALLGVAACASGPAKPQPPSIPPDVAARFWRAQTQFMAILPEFQAKDAAVKAVRAELDAVCGKEFVLADDNGLKCVPKPETKEATKK